MRPPSTAMRGCDTRPVNPSLLLICLDEQHPSRYGLVTVTVALTSLRNPLYANRTVEQLIMRRPGSLGCDPWHN
jgi:hypothetical protein